MIMFCLLFSSCTKQSSYSEQKSIEQPLDNNQDTILDIIIQQEAMLVDIPIPLYDARIISSSSYATESDTLTFGYKSPLSRNQAIDFFLNQMERLGWKLIVLFDAQEALLQFESPDRFCTVIIKNSENNTSGSSLFIYIKRASTNACP
jgi:hypothetical protein